MSSGDLQLAPAAPKSAGIQGAMPRRIALALESSGPGGAEQMVLRLAVALRDAGDDVVIATLRPGWMTERAEHDGLPVWVVPQKQGLDPLWIPRFARRLRRERVDLLHTHEFTMNVYAGIASRLAGIPSVATLHGRHWVERGGRRTFSYQILSRLGVPIVAVSNDLADFLAVRSHVPRTAIAVVHNGIPVPPALPGSERERRRRETRVELGIRADLPLLLAVGNLYAVKDHATLLRAAARLAGVQVAIAGRGPEERPLRTLARELRLGDRLHLLGLRDDVDHLLAAADVFVHPSRDEGLPVAILEAMAAAIPVVATRVGGIPEAVVDGDTGIAVAPGDPVALAEKLQELLGATELSSMLGARGRARVAAEFSIVRMLARYQAIYSRVAGRPQLSES